MIGTNKFVCMIANVAERTLNFVAVMQQSVLESSLAQLGFSRVIGFVSILFNDCHEDHLTIAIALSAKLL